METMMFKNQYGSEYEIGFVKTMYFDGNLAIVVEDKDPDCDYWETYANLTVNLGEKLPEDMAYLDTNNVPDLCEYAVENGWANIIGYERSGFCTYPLVVFTQKFLDDIAMMSY